MSKNKPSDAQLYAKVKSEAKKKFAVWPSAYGSAWLVKEYKRQYAQKHRGASPYRSGSNSTTGKLKNTRTGKKEKRPAVSSKNKKSRSTRSKSGSGGNLSRWFQEEWVNVCERSGSGRYKKCGRQSRSGGKYPYCRPSRRISTQTPRTVLEMSSSQLAEMCRKKRAAESKRRTQSPAKVYVSGASVHRAAIANQNDVKISQKIRNLLDMGYPPRLAVERAYQK